MEALFSLGVIFGGVLIFKFAVSLARSQNRKETLATWTTMPLVLGIWIVLGIVALAIVKWAFGVVF